MSRRLTAAAAIWVLAALAAPHAHADKVYTGWVIPETLVVRSGPGSDHRAVATVNRGQKVYVTVFRDGWCWGKLRGGQWGWVAEKFLQFSAEEGRAIARSAGTSGSASASSSSGGGEHGAARWIQAAGANVRTGPGTDNASYGTLSRGTKVYLLEKQSGWAKVKTPGGSGWVLADLLTDDNPGGGSVANSSSGSQVTLKAYVKGDGVYLRSGPGVRYDSRCSLRRGQTLYVFQRQGEWVKARVHDGAAGWVYSDLVKWAPDESHSDSGHGSSPGNLPNFPSPTRQYTCSTRLSDLPAWVDESGACVRYAPGVESDVKTVLERGTKLTVVDISGQWCKVRLPSGSYGWMAGWVLDFDGPGKEVEAKEGGKTVEVKVGWIARPEVNLRSGPGSDYDAVGKAALSTPVVILGEKEQWYKVGLDGGREAWVASWLVDTREQRQVRMAHQEESGGSGTGSPASSTGGGSPGGSDFAQSVVRTALGLNGHPYRWACSGEGGAFDCSGFTSYVYRQHGVDISRGVVEQYRQGIPVSRSELQMGDCVFFAGTCQAGISHVGLYIGDGKFIHAANPSAGVKITGLDEPYYASRYAGARRMR